MYRTSPLVQSICIHADPLHAYPLALVVPIPSAVSTHPTPTVSVPRVEPTGNGKPTPAAAGSLAVDDPGVQKTVLENLRRQGKRAGLSSGEIVDAVVVLSEEWTPENVPSSPSLTPSLVSRAPLNPCSYPPFAHRSRISGLMVGIIDCGAED